VFYVAFKNRQLLGLPLIQPTKSQSFKEPSAELTSFLIITKVIAGFIFLGIVIFVLFCICANFKLRRNRSQSRNHRSDHSMDKAPKLNQERVSNVMPTNQSSISNSSQRTANISRF